MNIEDIKKRLAYLPRELKDGGFSDNSLTFGARLDIEYLLSILEQYEHRMKITTVELQDWVRKFEVLVLDKEYIDASKKIIADNYEFHLQAIRGGK